jgi:hypothetical protein
MKVQTKPLNINKGIAARLSFLHCCAVYFKGALHRKACKATLQQNDTPAGLYFPAPAIYFACGRRQLFRLY